MAVPQTRAAVPVPERGFRRVMHCDLDCFFAAVEELDDPSLRGKPVIVGGDPEQRGVVGTANYVARRFGIHSAMSAAQARRLCPQAIFLRPHFERYRERSRAVMAILDEYFLVREQVSIDEAYGELPPGLPGCVPAERIAHAIKQRVRDATGLTISIGAAQTKSVAKIASDLNKPDGCVIVKPGTERAFLDPLAVDKLSGVGPHTRERLERIGILTIGALAATARVELERRFGKHGVWLWHLARGEDDRPVVADHGPPKSISREDTFAHDMSDAERLAERTRELAEDVARRTAAKGLYGRTVTLKIKWSDFRQMTRQRPLPQPSNSAAVIAHVALELLQEAVVPMLSPADAVRLVGVGISGISAAGDDEGDQLVATRASSLVVGGGWVQLPLFDPA